MDDPDKSAFYPIRADSKQTIEKYWKKFVCIDKEDMSLNGAFNSENARQMNIQIVRCSNEDEQETGIKCKEKEEITTFMKQKYLYMLYN